MREQIDEHYTCDMRLKSARDWADKWARRAMFTSIGWLLTLLAFLAALASGLVVINPH